MLIAVERFRVFGLRLVRSGAGRRLLTTLQAARKERPAIQPPKAIRLDQYIPYLPFKMVEVDAHFGDGGAAASVRAFNENA